MAAEAGAGPGTRAPEASRVAPRRRRRARWATLVRATVFVVVVGLLFWAGDSLARSGAESLVARDVQVATGTDELPDVRVRGTFFLPQVVRGSYSEVDVTTRNVTSGSLRIQRVDSRLQDVRVPFHDVLVRDVRRVGVGRSVEQAVVTYADINAYLRATGRPIQLAAAPGGEVRATGSIDVLNRRIDVDADISFGVSEGQLQLTPKQILNGGSGLGAASRLLLRQRLTFPVPMQSLPFGHQLTSVAPQGDHLAVGAVGTGIVVQP